jgi:hypothetical protein
MAYKYKAMRDGVLNNPYRFVQANEIITSPIEIDASWLAEIVEGQPIPEIPELPTFANIKLAQPNEYPYEPQGIDPESKYGEGMKDLKALEDKIDGAEETSGTGDQEVL